MKTITQRALTILDTVRSSRSITDTLANEIEALWSEAHKSLSLGQYRHEFMPVLEQIWKVAEATGDTQ